MVNELSKTETYQIEDAIKIEKKKLNWWLSSFKFSKLQISRI